MAQPPTGPPAGPPRQPIRGEPSAAPGKGDMNTPAKSEGPKPK